MNNSEKTTKDLGNVLPVFWYLFAIFLLIGSFTFIKEEKQSSALMLGTLYLIGAEIYFRINKVLDKIK